MTLPVAQVPKFKLTIPSTGKVVTYRPFLVREEKALLIAQQSEDPDVMLETLKSVLTSCVVDKIDINKLALFDIEYIFTQVRARSVSELVELVLRCDTCTDDKASVQYTIDLTKLKVDVPEGHITKIMLYNDVGVIMRYPSFDALKKMESMTEDDVEGMFDIVCMCVDSVFDSNEVYPAAEQEPEEIREFVNNLTQEQFKKIQEFFDTMPVLEQKVEYDCPICKKHHIKHIRGLDAFF